MIRWKTSSKCKRVVVDVDTQRCFLPGNGEANVQNNRTIIANIRRVMAWTRLNNIYVVSTKLVPVCYFDFRGGGIHNLDKISYTLRNRRIQFDATDCTDLPIEILEQYDQVILCKRCIDPFEEPRADRMLTELEADEFILIGSLIESAIRATALGLLARRKNVKVLIDAICSRDQAAAKIALQQIRTKGAKLLETRTLVGSSALHFVRQ